MYKSEKQNSKLKKNIIRTSCRGIPWAKRLSRKSGKKKKNTSVKICHQQKKGFGAALTHPTTRVLESGDGRWGSRTWDPIRNATHQKEKRRISASGGVAKGTTPRGEKRPGPPKAAPVLGRGRTARQSKMANHGKGGFVGGNFRPPPGNALSGKKKKKQPEKTTISHNALGPQKEKLQERRRTEKKANFTDGVSEKGEPSATRAKPQVGCVKRAAGKVHYVWKEFVHYTPSADQSG